VPTPNLPPGFDFTDPDIYSERIPVQEFAEVRATAPIWWNEQAPGTGGGFHDGGFWAVTRLNDVKEVSRRSDVFSSYENGVIPRFNNDIAREDIEVQRFVMLNMDAPHHTRLRKIISRGFTPRAVGRLEDELRPRVPATLSSRCPASFRCRRSRICWACRRRTAARSLSGRTR
jgi:cholest-4-en-3-one 26-monooxygenase